MAGAVTLITSPLEAGGWRLEARGKSAQGSKLEQTRRGFLSLEYAVLIAVCVASFIGMAVYISRSVRGKWRASADAVGFGRQYEPRVTAK